MAAGTRERAGERRLAPCAVWKRGIPAFWATDTSFPSGSWTPQCSLAVNRGAPPGCLPLGEGAAGLQVLQLPFCQAPCCLRAPRARPPAALQSVGHWVYACRSGPDVLGSQVSKPRRGAFLFTSYFNPKVDSATPHSQPLCLLAVLCGLLVSYCFVFFWCL